MAFFSGAVANVIRGSTIIPNPGTTVTLQNGVDYTLTDTDDSKWFFQITNNHYTGMGRTTNGGTHRPRHTGVWVTQSGADITLNRYDDRSGYDCRVDWEIIEYIGPSGFLGEFIIREKGVITAPDPSAVDQIINVPLPGNVVDVNDVVIFITGQASDDNNSDYFHEALFTAERGAIQWQARRGYSSEEASLSYAVVEMIGSGWTVTTEGPFTVGSENAVYNLNTPVSNVNNVITQAQFRYDQSGNSEVQDCSVKVVLQSTTQLAISNEGTNDLSDKYHYVYLLEHAGLMVNRYSGTIASGGLEETVVDVPITTVDDIANASMFGMSANSTGENNRFPAGYINFTLLDDSTLRLRRSDNRESQDWAVEVAEFPVIPTEIVLATGVESTPAVGNVTAFEQIVVPVLGVQSTPIIGTVGIPVIAEGVSTTAEIGTLGFDLTFKVPVVGVETIPALGDVQESPGVGVSVFVDVLGVETIIRVGDSEPIPESLWGPVVETQDPNWTPIDDRQVN